MSYRLILTVAGALAAGGCATVPAPLAGEFAPSTPRDVSGDGARVRWGGEIIDSQPRETETCFQILSRQLDATSRPRRSADTSDGRFIACRAGFFDPAIYDKGRELTVTGTVTGTETVRIGEYDYRLPRVTADALHLWPERYSFDEPYYYPTPAFYWGPYWGPPIIRYHHYHHPRPRPRDRD